MLYQPLEQYDPEVNDLIEKETWRQFSGLELIASEVSGNIPWRHDRGAPTRSRAPPTFTKSDRHRT